jgi:hypothetical protein
MKRQRSDAARRNGGGTAKTGEPEGAKAETTVVIQRTRKTVAGSTGSVEAVLRITRSEDIAATEAEKTRMEIDIASEDGTAYLALLHPLGGNDLALLLGGALLRLTEGLGRLKTCAILTVDLLRLSRTETVETDTILHRGTVILKRQRQLCQKSSERKHEKLQLRD